MNLTMPQLPDAGLKTTPNTLGKTPAPQDTVSQMKSYLAQSGYQAPAPTEPTGTGGWYDSVLTSRKDASDKSMGGFGEVVGNIGADFNKRADEVGKIQNSDKSQLGKSFDILGKGAAVVGDTFGDVVKSVVKPEILQKAGETLNPLIEKAKDSPAGVNVLNWWAELPPNVQDHLEAGGHILSLLSNAIGAGGAAKGAELGVDAATESIPKLVAPATEKATAAVQSVKDTATAAKDSIPGVKPKSFQDVYNAHAQSTKALDNSLERTEIDKNGKTISPIDTMETYQATPKVINSTSGGHRLDFTDVKAEAEANSKAASKVVDQKVADMATLNAAATSKKQLISDALAEARSDTKITTTGSLPGVESQIKQALQDAGIKGDVVTEKQLNDLRKGANIVSQAYYRALENASIAGTIPKDVTDRALAYATLGRIYRNKLVEMDPTLDDALTQIRVHNAVQEYAARAHLSSVGLSGTGRVMADAAGAAVGAAAGTFAGPLGPAIGAGIGVGLSEKAQAMLLRRTFEGAQKMGQSTSKILPESDLAGGTNLEGRGGEFNPINSDKNQSIPNQSNTNANITSKNTIDSSIPQATGIARAVKDEKTLPLGMSMKSVVPEPSKFARYMDAKDIKIVRNYLNVVDKKVAQGGPEDLQASMAMDQLLTDMGLNEKSFPTQKAKDAYITALRDEFEAGDKPPLSAPKKK